MKMYIYINIHTKTQIFVGYYGKRKNLEIPKLSVLFLGNYLFIQKHIRVDSS